MWLGTSAKSRTMAAQNSTLVAIDPVGTPLAQLLERGLLQRLGDLEARGAELLGGPPQHAGARVLGAVDAVAEAHEPLAAVEEALARTASASPLSLDAVDHVQHPGRARRRAAGPTSRRWRRTAQAATSAPVEAMTRAVKVEAFMPCSAADVQ